MRLLVLGGTVFAGRHLVELALERGHDVTLFNRGQTGPGLFPEVERVRGERAGDLEGLRGRRFDAVVDTSGYLPTDVERSAGLLAETAGPLPVRVQPQRVRRSLRARARTRTRRSASCPRGRRTTRSQPRATGRSRRAASRPFWAAFGDRAVILRPGLIVGPPRPDRPLHVLATAGRRGWRRARTGAARAADPGDRRPRPGGVRARPARARRGRHVRRRLARRHAHARRRDRCLPAGEHGRVADRVGGRGVPARARRRAVERDPAVDARRRLSPASSARTSPARSPPACTYARSQTRSPTRCAGHGSTTPPAAMRSRGSERPSSWPSGAAADRGGTAAARASLVAP